MFESGYSEGELCHWVKIIRAAVDELGNELRDVGAGSQFGGQITNLLLAWNLAGQKEPEQTYCWLTQTFFNGIIGFL